MTGVIRIWFLTLCVLGVAGYLATVIRFRVHRSQVERKIGPVPVPAPVVAFAIAAVVLATGIGELPGEWWLVRGTGVGLSLVALVLVPWTARALGPLFIPGAAVLQDHELVTAGPFRLVRHPLLTSVLLFWLGAALGTLNWILLALWIPLLAAAVKSSRPEEELLRGKFGAAYEIYAARTGRFFPRLRKRTWIGRSGP